MLLKKKDSKFWIFRTRVNGKTWERSTGETDKRKAEAKAAQLANLAELHRRQPAESLSLEKAILAEVDRVESDVSDRQAIRVRDALMNFLKWRRKALKKQEVPLDRISATSVLNGSRDFVPSLLRVIQLFQRAINPKVMCKIT